VGVGLFVSCLFFVCCLLPPSDLTEFASSLSNSVNMGRGRTIPRQKQASVKIHRTVKIRQDAGGLKQGPYKPKAKVEVEPVWMD
jgi:hypothetical protein